jgi:hypothetical protein
MRTTVGSVSTNTLGARVPIESICPDCGRRVDGAWPVADGVVVHRCDVAEVVTRLGESGDYFTLERIHRGPQSPVPSREWLRSLLH